MKSRNNQQGNRLAAIAVDSSDLHVCVSCRQSDGSWSCETSSLSWRHEATSLNTQRGELELTDALRRVVSEMKLSGVPAWVSLPGNYCVTRIATGDEEQVREEVAQLKDRSELYLSLGHGPKSLASSMYTLDARRRVASLAVVNERTLDALVTSFSKSGLRLERVESSAVSLSRLVGSMRDEDSPPAIVLSCDERGVEVGIVHQGRLMLDYRPASAANSSQVAATLLRHLGRLRRYCQRYIGITNGKLEDVYLLGAPETVAALRAQLTANQELKVHDLLDPWSLASAWHSSQEDASWTMAAPLGLSMLRDDTSTSAAPNLLEGMKTETQEPLAKVLRPLLMPLAATLAAVAVAWLGAWYQGRRCKALERQYAELELELRDARLMQTKVMHDQQLLTGYRKIDAALTRADWASLTENIAQCLPADTWLDSVSVEPDGLLQFGGGSYSDDGVLQFARWLANVPQLKNVAVGGTQPGRFSGGSGTQFDVHGEITGLSEGEDRTDDRT